MKVEEGTALVSRISASILYHEPGDDKELEVVVEVTSSKCCMCRCGKKRKVENIFLEVGKIFSLPFFHGHQIP